MSVISTLSVSLVARTSKFTQGLSRARKSLSGFQRSTRSMQAGIGRVAGGLAALAGVGGLAALVQSQREAIDTTGKLADLFSVTTEQLVGYQHAASLADVSNEALTTSLRMFQKNLAMARDGSKEAADAFAAMGLDPDQLGLMSTDAALKAVADRLPMITDQFTRTQTALALFGRSGLPFVKVLQDGAAGLSAAQDEARALGLTFSRVDAAQVEAANDAITRMQGLFTAVGRTIAIEISPFIQAFAESLTAAGISGEGFGMKVSGAMEAVWIGVQRGIQALDVFRAGWFTIKGTIEAVAGAALEFFARIQEGLRDITTFVTGRNTWRGPSVARDMAKAFKESSKSSFAEVADASKSLQQLVNGETTAKISKFFDDINARARGAAEKAAAAAALPSNGLSGGPGAPGGKGDPFGAKQVNLANVFVGALKSAKREKQATADEGTHSRLEKINRSLQRLGGMQAVTV